MEKKKNISFHTGDTYELPIRVIRAVLPENKIYPVDLTGSTVYVGIELEDGTIKSYSTNEPVTLPNEEYPSQAIIKIPHEDTKDFPVGLHRWDCRLLEMNEGEKIVTTIQYGVLEVLKPITTIA